MEPNEPLTELTTPELERLVREKQGDKIQRYEYVTGEGFIADRAVTHTFAVPLEPEDFTEENAYFTDTEWLDLLNRLPPNIQFEFGLDDQGEPELRVRNSDFLDRYLCGFSFKDRSEALKRATLIAYLEHAT